MHGALLALPFGLAIGLSLGLVGGGGSILAVPVLVYVIGEQVKQATTESLLIVGATALVGGLDQARDGRVRWRVAAGFGVGGAGGALPGTALNRIASPSSILFAFALVMFAAAYAMLRRKGEGGAEETDAHGRTLWLRVVPAGVGVGFLTGFFGVGGGFVIVPALVLLLGLPMPVAVGTSLLVIALTSASALVAHLANGSIDWSVAAAFTGAAVAGALAGSRLGARLSSARLTQLFAALIVAVALFLIAKNIAAVV
ncbi:MAG: sulfite exporter TauE/SafE family protein [Actinomycetota bacterium]|nr:sulfite exporter TauE/SafE family protein [Actinomycetota bacterium]